MRELTDEEVETFRRLDALNPMKVMVIDSENDAIFQHLCNTMEAQGFKMACASNAGLPRGKMRVTFLPASYFKTEEEMVAAGLIEGPPRTTKPQVDLNEFVKGLDKDEKDA